jgi:hypothetical protein
VIAILWRLGWIHDVGTSEVWSGSDVAKGLQNYLICFEMLVVSEEGTPPIFGCLCNHAGVVQARWADTGGRLIDSRPYPPLTLCPREASSPEGDAP